MALSKETVEFSMSLCAALAAVDIAAATGCDTTTALARLLQSQTGEMLYDDALKLWQESPRDTAEAYLREAHLPVPPDW